MPFGLFKDKTKKLREQGLITGYVQFIEQTLLPEINRAAEINIMIKPISERQSTITYEDSENNIKLEFACGHRALSSINELFVYVNYNGRRSQGGIIDTTDLEGCIDIILIALHDLDYKSKSDVEYDKEQEKIKRDKELEAQRQKALEKRKKLDSDMENPEEPELEPESEPEPEPEEISMLSEDEINTLSNNLNKTFDYVKDLPEGIKIVIEFLVINSIDGTSRKINQVGFDITHVSGNNYLIESNKLKPKVEKIVNADMAIEYIMKATSKINSIPIIRIEDEKGKIINLPPEEDETDYIDIG